MSSRVLITGSSGFIGTSVCERLGEKNDREIHGVDRVPPKERFEGVVYHSAELSSQAQVRRVVQSVEPDIIVHLAAQARVGPSLIDPYATYRDNVVATVNLVSAAIGLGTDFRRLVYASSETVYGRARKYPTPESAKPNPGSPYAASKAASEALVLAALGSKATILRSGMGYGPRSDPQAQVVAKFLVKALSDDSLCFPARRPGLRHPTRDLNFVSNFVDGLEQAIELSADGIYNIASGHEVSILDLAHRVISAAGSGRVEHSDEYQYRAGEEGLRTWLDITRAKDRLGYRPRIDLETGLALTARWMRDNRLESMPRRDAG